MFRLPTNRPISPQLAETLRRRTATFTGAVLIGLVALGFAFAADWAQGLFSEWSARWWWATLVTTPLGFATLVWLTRRYFPEARSSGIPQVIAAAQLKAPEHSPLISLKTAAAKLGLTVAALSLGASAGREGPTVQISAAVMTATHRLFRVPLSAAVVIAGGAAGVSAAFNTPLAGIAFAVEELAAAYEQRLTLLVMAAVMVSGLVSLGLAGDYLYFGAQHETFSIQSGLLVVPVIALLGGTGGALFSRLVLFVSVSSAAVLAPVRRHPVWFAAGCGLLVAVVGAASGVSWGTGYEPARALIEGDLSPSGSHPPSSSPPSRQRSAGCRAVSSLRRFRSARGLVASWRHCSAGCRPAPSRLWE